MAFGYAQIDRAHRGLLRRAGPRRPELLGGPVHRLRRQRARRLPDERGPHAVHRRRPRASPRAARPARHAAHAHEVGQPDRASHRGARARHRGAAARRVGPAAARRGRRRRGTSSAMRAAVADDAGAGATGERAPPIDPNAIDRLADLLAGARRPLIMVGSGAQHASAEVLALAEHLQAPVVPFRSGRGIVSDEHPLGITCGEGFELWPRPTSSSASARAWSSSGSAGPAPRRPQGRDDRHRPAPGHAAGGLAERHRRCRGRDPLLTEALTGARTRAPSRAEELAGVKAATAAKIAEVTPHAQFLGAIRDVLPRDGFFVEEICQAGFAATYALPVYEPRTLRVGRPPGDARLRLPDVARREGRASGSRRRVDHRRRRLPVRPARSSRPPCRSASAS